MEVGRNLLYSSPLFLPKTHFRSSIPSSVPILHEQATLAVTSTPTTSITRHFPTSVLLQEQRDEFRPLLQIREDKTSQATLDRRQTDNGVSFCEEKKSCQSDQYLKDFERRLLYWPGLWYLLPSLYKGEKPLLSMTAQSIELDADKIVFMKPCDVLALAKEAVLASRQAASLVEESNLFGADFDDSFPRMRHTSSSIEIPLEEEIKVRSKRLLERRTKRHRVSKSSAIVHETPSLRTAAKHSKLSEGFDPNDPLRLFLSGSETKQLLTAKEELELFAQIQELTRLEEVKRKLQSQFDREPTLIEWAKAVGMSCRTLKFQIHSGNRSREKITYANFRMVVHVAKQYYRWGLSLQDLMQDGSIGLMKSIEKFKPQQDCRFSSYAYWWIRQAIRKAIFQKSRTVRLPENVFNTLRQIRNAREQFVQEGHQPTNEELAKRVGLTVGRLETLLVSTRVPLSMQQPVWSDQDTTFQEITADTEVEIPDLSVTKQLMRRHVRNLLSILSPKERRIVRLRYGIEDGQQKSLSQIGLVFGISKERVRQLENQAMGKLRKCMSSQGLEAYSNLLI